MEEKLLLTDEELIIARRKNLSKIVHNKHYHNSYEILFLVSGACNVFVKNRDYQLKQGDLLLINKYHIHKVIYVDKESFYHRYVTYFKDSFLQKFTAQKVLTDVISTLYQKTHPKITLDPSQIKTLTCLFKNILLEEKQKKINYQYLISSLFFEVLILIHRYSQLNGHHCSKKTHDQIESLSREETIIAFIDDNYNKSLSLDIIAKELSISKYYLSHYFKKKTGFTIIEFINNKRILEAQKLLTSSNYSITEVAYQVGFNNSTHFGRVFKELTSIPPSEYRVFAKKPWST